MFDAIAVIFLRADIQADPDVAPGGTPLDPSVELEDVEEVPGEGYPPLVQEVIESPVGPGGPVFEYKWASPCSAGPDDPEQTTDCEMARRCPEGELFWLLWRRALSTGTWEILGGECLLPAEMDATEAPIPVVTPGMVLREVRRIGLPALRIEVQPADETLVNLETIFHTRPEPFAHTVTLLGQSVEVEATARQFAWSFGDGAGLTTDGPGAPYPSTDVTHTYARADLRHAPSVDVTYGIRFRVDGGEWQEVEETVTAAGPSVSLQVSEATPVLVGD